jgi:hypothetical protein
MFSFYFKLQTRLFDTDVKTLRRTMFSFGESPLTPTQGSQLNGTLQDQILFDPKHYSEKVLSGTQSEREPKRFPNCQFYWTFSRNTISRKGKQLKTSWIQLTISLYLLRLRHLVTLALVFVLSVFCAVSLCYISSFFLSSFLPAGIVLFVWARFQPKAPDSLKAAAVEDGESGREGNRRKIRKKVFSDGSETKKVLSRE